MLPQGHVWLDITAQMGQRKLTLWVRLMVMNAQPVTIVQIRATNQQPVQQVLTIPTRGAPIRQPACHVTLVNSVTALGYLPYQETAPKVSTAQQGQVHQRLTMELQETSAQRARTAPQDLHNICSVQMAPTLTILVPPPATTAPRVITVSTKTGQNFVPQVTTVLTRLERTSNPAQRAHTTQCLVWPMWASVHSVMEGSTARCQVCLLSVETVNQDSSVHLVSSWNITQTF